MSMNPDDQGGKVEVEVVSENSLVNAKFSGPLPPPQVLRQYEEICPGISGKILDSVLEEASERRRTNAAVILHSQEMARIALDAEREAMRSERQLFRRGQVFALVISTLAIAGMFMAIALAPSAVTVTILAGLFGLGGFGVIIKGFLRDRDLPVALPKPGEQEALPEGKPNS